MTRAISSDISRNISPLSSGAFDELLEGLMPLAGL
jgi:hypothetical protein